jgi:hypothetical protein
MGSFSFGRAVGAGFRVIGRHPLAVLAWAAVYLVFVILPALALAAYALPALIAATKDMASHAGGPDLAQIMAFQTGVFGWQPAVWLLSVVVTTVVTGATFRAVLEPQNSRWAYLRLSRQELWLGLTLLVLVVMAFILMFLLLIPFGIGAGMTAAIAKHGGSTGAAVLMLVLLGLVAMGVLVWLGLRLSLALPMSFAQARFLLYESWDLTRGQALRMFLVYLALAVGLWLVEVVVVILIAAWAYAHFGGAPPRMFADGVAPADVFRRFWPMIVGFAAIGSVVATAIRTIFVAPLAEIYRELTSEAGPAA